MLTGRTGSSARGQARGSSGSSVVVVTCCQGLVPRGGAPDIRDFWWWIGQLELQHVRASRPGRGGGADVTRHPTRES